ncbi:hypothetical protein ACFL59_06730 [Planctomycetota bacterium]
MGEVGFPGRRFGLEGGDTHGGKMELSCPECGYVALLPSTYDGRHRLVCVNGECTHKWHPDLPDHMVDEVSTALLVTGIPRQSQLSADPQGERKKREFFSTSDEELEPASDTEGRDEQVEPGGAVG